MDRLLHVEIELGQARALVAETTELVRQAPRLHGLSHTAGRGGGPVSWAACKRTSRTGCP